MKSPSRISDVFVVLLLFCGSLRAQTQVDFQQSTAAIDSLVDAGDYDKGRSELYTLIGALHNTSLEREDSVQVYFVSKLAFMNFRLHAMDSAVAQGKREVALRSKMHGPGDMQTLASRHNLGVYFLSMGLADSAKRVLLKTIQLHNEHYTNASQVLLVTLDDLAYAYGDLNLPDSAVYFYKQLLDNFNTPESKTSFYLHVIDNYSALLISNGRFEEAASFYPELLKYKEGSEDYLSFLRDYYNVFVNAKDYAQALGASESILDFCKGDADQCHSGDISVRTFQLNSARLNMLLARYNEAYPLYQRVLAESDGDRYEHIVVLLESAEAAGRLNRKGDQLKQLSDALELHRSYGLTDSSTFSSTVFQLGSLYTGMGKFDMAETIFEQYIQDLQKDDNADPVELARAYQSLGNQRFLLQNYRDADRYFNMARALLDQNRKGGAKRGREYASVLNSLGALNEALANHEQAEKYYREAFAIVSGREEQADALKSALATNLANLLMKIRPGDPAIDSLLDQALALQESLTGRQHPAFANLLGNRAMHRQKQGSVKEAESDYVEALDILGRTVGKDHPDYLNHATNLAMLYEESGRYDAAVQYLLDVRTRYEQNYSYETPGFLRVINNLAKVYTELKKYDEAEVLLLNLADKQVEEIEQSFTYLSESEKQKFVEEKRKFLDNFKRYVISRISEDPASVSDAVLTKWYNLELATKGILLNSTRRVRDQIFASGDQELVNLFSRWTLIRKEIATLRSLKSSWVEQNEGLLDSLTTQIDVVEKELSRKSATFASSFQYAASTFDDVRNSLQPGEAAIEIVKTELDSGSVYSALLVMNKLDAPQIVFLGDGEALEKKGFLFYRNSIKFKLDDVASFGLFWSRIHSVLRENGITRVYYAPDGVYHSVSLATLYDPQAKDYLVDEYEIVQLTSTRELVQAAGKNPTRLQDLSFLLVGRPRYNLDETSLPPTDDSRQLIDIRNLGDLPGTEEEVSTIGKIFDQNGIRHEILLHENATEEKVKQALDFQVVHIATHGFFLDQTGKQGGLDPMLYSGLLLAGVSNNHTGEDSGADGILTAYEIMNLDYSGLRIVVLSACETGLGEVAAGEGIYGLQRAFLAAGANVIVMSLWKVEDEATKELMIELYKGLLKTGNIREAFNDARKRIRRKFKDPVSWGGFVMVGI